MRGKNNCLARGGGGGGGRGGGGGGGAPPSTVEVRDFSQTWYTYDYKIGINKYPGNAREIS
jgi:hypothetical protein